VVSEQVASIDANDTLYAFEASRDYDPESDVSKITAPMVAVNSADDYLDPPSLGIIDRGIKRVKNGRYVLVPASDQTRGHPDEAAHFPACFRASRATRGAQWSIPARSAQTLGRPFLQGSVP
jgi:homoserine acetyltransferase